MKEHVVRLLPGEDILERLEMYCRKFNIEAAYIATCVGSLSALKFRKGLDKKVLALTGNFEIVSMVGTLSKTYGHIHMSVSDTDFNVKGGHMTRGCIVHSTAEIVLVELEEHQLRRSKDEMSGYKELHIIRVNKVCKQD